MVTSHVNTLVYYISEIPAARIVDGNPIQKYHRDQTDNRHRVQEKQKVLCRVIRM
jgi:hypothetical protein